MLSDDFGILDLSAFKDRKDLVVFEPLKQKILGSYDEIHGIVEVFDDFVIIGSKTEFGDRSSHVFEFFSGDRFDFVSSYCLDLFNLVNNFFDGFICLLKTRITEV